MKTLKLLAVSGLIAAACISPVMAADSKKISATTAEFLKNAAIGGKFEVDSSKVALQRSQNDNVKQFAQKMIDDHSKANDELKSTAAAEDIDSSAIPADLDTKHQAILDKLNADSNDSFDKDYIKAQTDAHKEAIAAFTKYSNKGDDKALKEFATNTLPTLQEHKSMLPSMKAGQ